MDIPDIIDELSNAGAPDTEINRSSFDGEDVIERMYELKKRANDIITERNS